jgi:hypothetical protein
MQIVRNDRSMPLAKGGVGEGVVEAVAVADAR